VAPAHFGLALITRLAAALPAAKRVVGHGHRQRDRHAALAA
jgi:hypothetical protein